MVMLIEYYKLYCCIIENIVSQYPHYISWRNPHFESQLQLKPGGLAAHRFAFASTITPNIRATDTLVVTFTTATSITTE